MKVYVYGTYVPGENGRRIREYTDVTHDIHVAFAECYEVGLDGHDYFLIEYDIDTQKKKQIWITDSSFYRVFENTKRLIEAKYSLSTFLNSTKSLRPEDV